MTTTSYPAVGKGGLSGAKWSAMYGTEDGIVEDYHVGGVEACVLSRSGDVATISPGKVKVNGYVLSIDTPTSFDMPPVTSTTVYQVLAVYDENLNIPLPNTDPPQADPLGPCRLVVSVGDPAASTSRSYFLLYSVTRAAGQALTAATVVDNRQWNAALRVARAKPPATGIPRGTVLYAVNAVADGRYVAWVMDVNAAGTGLDWRNLTAPTPYAFPYVGSYQARAAGTAPEYFFTNGLVKMRGDLARSGSSTLGTKSGSQTVGAMPAGARPKYTERFVCKTSGTDGQAEVRVESTGEVTVSQTGGDVGWVNLSPVCYRAEN